MAVPGRCLDGYSFEHLRIWSDHGLIHIEDLRNNGYECFSVRAILHRLNAISETLRNSLCLSINNGAMPCKKFELCLTMLEKMEPVCRMAKSLGSCRRTTRR